MQARDEKLMLAWLEARPPHTCPGCGRPMETVVPGSGKRGRTRIWCSNACRQRAYRARKAGTQTAQPEAPRAEHSPAPDAPTLEECIVTVLESPTAVASVLDVVRRALLDGALDKHEYTEVQTALLALHEALTINHP
jgi:ribosomal protein L37AE/L43A